MKTFKQHLNEEEAPGQQRINGFRAALVPAIQHPSGKVYMGWRGKTHADIRLHHADEEGKPLIGAAGYVDRRNGKFHHKYGQEGLNMDSSRLQPDVDSTDLMSPVQRMRKFGTFEEGMVLDHGDGIDVVVE